MTTRASPAQLALIAPAISFFLFMCVKELNPSSFVNRSLFGSAQSQEPIPRGAEIKSEIDQLAAGHNIALQFKGFDYSDPISQLLVRQISWGTTYRLWPHRAWVVPETTSQSAIDEKWFFNHDIQSMLSFSSLPGHRFETQSFDSPSTAVASLVTR